MRFWAMFDGEVYDYTRANEKMPGKELLENAKYETGDGTIKLSLEPR